MSLRKNLIFGGLFLCLVFQLVGCGNSDESASENKNYNVAVGEPEKPRTESAKPKEEAVQPPAVSEDDVKKTKNNLDALVKKIPGLDLKGEIGPKNLNDADKFCRGADKRQTDECKSFFNEMKKLIRDVGNYCKSEPEKCTEKIDSADNSVKHILNFCKTPENDTLKNYPECQTIREPGTDQITNNTNQATNDRTSSPSPSPSPTPSPGIFGNIGNLLLYGAAGLLGLAVLGGIVWLANSFLTSSFDKERKATEHGFRVTKTHVQTLEKKVKDLEETVRLQSGQLSQMQTAIKSLQRQSSESGGQTFREETFTPQVRQPEPKFPASAENYLAKNSGNAQIATADVFSGLLINDPEKGKEFLIVGDSELGDSYFYAVPNRVRFNKAGDYLNFYQNHYALDNPSGGAIWIRKPAKVRRVENGWELVEQGELEVR